MATFEEASRCPKCEQPGRPGSPQPSAKPGVRVVPVTCENERCRWYNTGWLVQLNPDGSVPDPSETPRGPKQFDRADGLTIAQNMQQAAEYAQFFQDRSTGGPR